MDALIGLAVMVLVGYFGWQTYYNASKQNLMNSLARDLEKEGDLPLTELEKKAVEAVKDNYTFWTKNKYGIYFFKKGEDITTGKLYILNREGKIEPSK